MNTKVEEMTAKEQGLPELPPLPFAPVDDGTKQWFAEDMYAYATAYARAALASDTGERGVVVGFDDWPEFHAQGMGCGLEDRGITDRYDAMRYGWDEALDAVAERITNHEAALRAQPAGGGEEDFHDRLYGMKFSLFLDADGVTGDETKIDLTCGATIGDEALFHVTDGRVLTFATPPESGGQGDIPEASAWLAKNNGAASREWQYGWNACRERFAQGGGNGR